MIVVMRMIPRCIRVFILFLNLAFFLIPCTYCDNTSRYDGSNSTSPIIASALAIWTTHGLIVATGFFRKANMIVQSSVMMKLLKIILILHIFGC